MPILSRSRFTAYILAALLFGGAIGIAGTALVFRSGILGIIRDFFTEDRTAPALRRKMESARQNLVLKNLLAGVTLRPGQVVRIRTIMKKYAGDASLARDAFRKAMIRIMDAIKKDIETELTPQQKKQFRKNMLRLTGH